jgi:hypothetical protein
VANCSVRVWEYLREHSRVTHIDDYLDPFETTPLTTSSGEMTAADLAALDFDVDDGQAVLLHEVPGWFQTEILASDTTLQCATDWARDCRFKKPTRHRTLDTSEVIYAPVTASQLAGILPVFAADHVYLLTDEYEKLVRKFQRAQRFGSSSKLYARIRLPEWTETPEFRMLSGALDEQRSAIEAWAQLHDAGGQPPSQWLDDPDSYEGPTLHEVLTR